MSKKNSFETFLSSSVNGELVVKLLLETQMSVDVKIFSPTVRYSTVNSAQYTQCFHLVSSTSCWTIWDKKKKNSTKWITARENDGRERNTWDYSWDLSIPWPHRVFFDDPTVNYRNILFNTEVRKQISLTLRFQKCEVGM